MTSQRFVDLFCGTGLFSQGAERAGLTPELGINHWGVACKLFKAAHRDTPVHQQDLALYDYGQLPRVPGLIGGPSCKGFTKARGTHKPKVHDPLRALMGSIPNALEAGDFDWAVVENVAEVTEWIRWDAWKLDVELCGYSLRVHRLQAEEFGSASERDRVFIHILRGKHRAMPDWAGVLQDLRRPGPVADDVLDWDYSRWSRLTKPDRSPKVLRQWHRAYQDGVWEEAVGRGQHSSSGVPRFLFPYYGSGSGLTGRAVTRPMATVVAHDVWAVTRWTGTGRADRASSWEMRMLQPHEAFAFMDSAAPNVTGVTRRDLMRAAGNGVPVNLGHAAVSAALESV